uniref:Uncharacterized protein n=1 Tax=Hyaloperonospora arabidopsidis (strain Emoy2) TaxID=559515 RepID=M4BNG0_HYAAE
MPIRTDSRVQVKRTSLILPSQTLHRLSRVIPSVLSPTYLGPDERASWGRHSVYGLYRGEGDQSATASLDAASSTVARLQFFTR